MEKSKRVLVFPSYLPDRGMAGDLRNYPPGCGDGYVDNCYLLPIRDHNDRILNPSVINFYIGNLFGFASNNRDRIFDLSLFIIYIKDSPVIENVLVNTLKFVGYNIKIPYEWLTKMENLGCNIPWHILKDSDPL